MTTEEIGNLAADLEQKRIILRSYDYVNIAGMSLDDRMKLARHIVQAELDYELASKVLRNAKQQYVSDRS